MTRRVALMLTCLLCLMIMGCGTLTRKSNPTPTPAPLAVAERRTTYQVQRMDLVDILTVRGQVVPARQQELYFKASGRVSRVTAQRGDLVKKGDLLAELEMEDLLRQVQQATIDLETAEAKLAEDEKSIQYAVARAQHQVNMQQIQVDLARLALADAAERLKIAEIDLEKASIVRQRAQADYDRFAWQQGFAASPQAAALQQADLDYQAAEARLAQETNAKTRHQLQLKLADENLALAKLALEEIADWGSPSEGISLHQKRAVERAKIALDRLNAQVEEHRIYAPFDGILLSGNIRPADPQEAFEVVFTIGDPTQLVIAVYELADKRLDRIDEDTEITFTTYGHEDEPVKAQLLTRFYPIERARAEILQADYIYFAMEKVWPDLQAGDSVEIRGVLDRREDVLVVPLAVIRRFLSRTFVVVQEGDLQKRVDVQTGLTTDTWAEVEGELQEGDVVLAP